MIIPIGTHSLQVINVNQDDFNVRPNHQGRDEYIGY